MEKDADVWTYWRLLEAEVFLNGADFRDAQGRDAPVLHVELMNTPVVTEDGRHISDHFYTYVRYAAERVGGPGVQGGTIRSAMEEAGDLLQPLKAGTIGQDHFRTELGEVVLGRTPGRESDSEITFFKSVGVAIQDLCAAERALKNAEKMGLGKELD